MSEGREPPTGDTDDLVRFGVSMPSALVSALDRWRERRGYGSRSEAIRDLVRDALVLARWEADHGQPEAESVGVVLLVYNHHTRLLGDQLTDMQHHAAADVVASLHIHLTRENCLEVIVLRGAQAEVRDLAQRLLSARGVLHGAFMPTTTGENLA